MASAQDELEEVHFEHVVPWWRVLKDGKPSPHMPGGVEHRMARLRIEGVTI
jgi:alkylated DNA nucleotide flippase Atl1